MNAYLFWKNIDEARKDKKSLKEVCHSHGIAYQRIADQRSECRFPKLEDAYLIASSYKVSLEYLLTGMEEDFTYLSPEALEVQKDKDLRSVVSAILINKEVIPGVIAFISTFNQELKNIGDQKNETSSKIS